MKSFNEFLKEDSEGPDVVGYHGAWTKQGQSIDNVGWAAHALDNPQTVARLNTYIGSVSVRSWADYMEPVLFIYNRLMQTGIVFDIKAVQKTLSICESEPLYAEVHLAQFGGRYGMNPDTGEVGFDDYIESKVGYPLTLCITAKCDTSGRYYVEAVIKPETDRDEDTIDDISDVNDGSPIGDVEVSIGAYGENQDI